jgi:hypothetical protein
MMMLLNSDLLSEVQMIEIQCIEMLWKASGGDRDDQSEYQLRKMQLELAVTKQNRLNRLNR